MPMLDARCQIHMLLQQPSIPISISRGFPILFVQLRRQFEASIKKIGNGEDKEEVLKAVVTLVTDAIRTTVAGMLFIDPSVAKETHTVVDHGIDSLLPADSEHG
ncbi:hypothetical protein PENVUL_c010G06726 [Penicillium vulpinum]|uniref:Uncharacterized protein n=1 Tax=Penicillium vulpinum TaxID=29845 RepID=A0A1V6S2P3_9EURO|nr:hypothetical protein PENVUL_c010G06726 [Penicillium vulpinum]